MAQEGRRSRLAMSTYININVWMKRNLFLLFNILTSLGLTFLASCGDDATQSAKPDGDEIAPATPSLEKPEVSRQARPSAPLRTDEPPPPSEWVGNSAYYAATFEERMEVVEREKTIVVQIAIPDTDGVEIEAASRNEEKVVVEPVNLMRLYVRAGSLPFTGSVTRLYLSGTPEFHATFGNGFRTGIAYWWNAGGKLLQAVKGWGDEEEELDVNAIADDPLSQITQKLAATEPDPNKPIFRGTHDGFDDWNNYGEDGKLVDGSTGEVVSGQIKLYGENGKLESETSYLDGQMHGASNSYHANGVQSMKMLYSRGEKTGTETWWGDNGMKSYEANYSNGKRNGLETIWDETGAILSQQRYQEGELVETVYEKK